MTFFLGLTGGIASGKTTVLEMFADLGAATISADAIVHKLLSNDAVVKESVQKLLGPSVIKADGSVDRGAVGRYVFQDERKLRALENLLHPRVRQQVDEWREETSSAGVDIGVAEIPLLFETGNYDCFDATIVVSTEHASQINRLSERKLSESEARARIAAQLPLKDKERRADFVIINNNSLKCLQAQVETLWEKVNTLIRRKDVPQGL